MKITALVLTVLLTISTAIRAEGPPLVVAVESFEPPFVMETSNDQFYGFDIAMMEYICQQLNRTCQYRIMPFDQLINAVANRQAEVAVSAITITPERALLVNFSTPYLISEASFLANADLARYPFDLSLLQGRKIGVVTGTVFADLITTMGIVNPQIVNYTQLEDSIEALNNGDIDLALMDEPTAFYWQSQSSGLMRMVGKPFAYGYGLGIAINRDNVQLLQQINQVLLTYQNSDAYKLAYQKYIAHF